MHSSNVILALISFVFGMASAASPTSVGEENVTNYGLAGETGIYSSCVTERSIALTYDDGPSGYTEELLDVLARQGVKATFFVVGVLLEDPEYAGFVQRAYTEGHQIASHSFTHPNLASLSYEDVVEEIEKTEEIIYQTIGVRVRYFRPPYGAYNDQVNNILFARDYKSVLWNLDTKDWEHLDGDQIIAITMDALAYQNENPNVSYISLMHDIHKSTVDAQEELIMTIKSTYPDVRFQHVDVCMGFTRGDGYRPNGGDVGVDAPVVGRVPVPGSGPNVEVPDSNSNTEDDAAVIVLEATNGAAYRLVTLPFILLVEVICHIVVM